MREREKDKEKIIENDNYEDICPECGHDKEECICE